MELLNVKYNTQNELDIQNELELNVYNELKNRLIYKKVLNKVKARYEFDKEIENINFKFLEKVKYEAAYFKYVPIDKMLYSTLVNNNVYDKLTSPLIDDINFINEFLAAMRRSEVHEKVYISLLIDGIKKYIGKVTKENLFNIYIATIYKFFSKYNLQDVHALIWIMDKIMTKIYIKEKPVHIQFQFVTKVLNNFSQISSYILLEGIENGVLKIDVSKATMMKVDDIKTNTINMIYKYCFNFIDKIDSNIFTTVKEENIREYIQIIGVEHYKNYVKMIIDELSIVDEIELNFRFMTFKTMNKYYQVLDNDLFCKIAMIFAKQEIMDKEILETMKKMNSKFVDVYTSYMVMKEMKNGTI